MYSKSSVSQFYYMMIFTSMSLNNHALSVNRRNTSQFSRCFIPASIRLWNTLPTEIVSASNCETFKNL